MKIEKMDKEIINHFFKNGKIIATRCSSTHFNLNDCSIQEYKKYLENRYIDAESLQEILYRIYLKIEIRPTCELCGNKVKYLGKGQFAKHCSSKCNANDKKTKIKKQNTCKEKYGVDSYSKTTEFLNKIKEINMQNLGVEYPAQNKQVYNKFKNTCKEKYGVDNPLKSKILRDKGKITKMIKYGDKNFNNYEKIKNTRKTKYGDENYNNREKYKKTCQEKYGVDNILCLSKIHEKSKKTCQEKYGVDYYIQTDEFKIKYKNNINRILNKKYNTKKKNNSFNKSKKEDELYNILLKEYPDTIRQYKSDLYPFACDFYIPSKDLYIEYNGTWTHGGHLFDPMNINDIEKLNRWKEKSLNSKFYKNAIYTWTDLDVRKRNIAKENNLNYLEIWNLNNINI